MPEVSTVAARDYEELATFLATFPEDESGSATSWLNRMHAWWDLNPAYVDGFARGWLLRENGRIVGFLGSIPLAFQLGGQNTTVFAGTTWRVLPRFRGMSIVLKRRQMEEHKDVLHFSTTPRAEVARLLELLGYEPIRKWANDHSYSVIILNPEKILRTKLQKLFLGKAVARCLAPLSSAIQSFRIRSLKRSRHESVRELTQAYEVFDELWERTRMKYANTNVRTAEVINWYCFSSIEFEKKLFGYFEGERLAGYMMFMTSERRGVKFFECVDMWIDPQVSQAQILGALVERARQFAERNSYDRMHLPHFNREAAAIFRRLGLLELTGRRRPEYYKGPKEAMDQFTSANSYFVLAQGDYGL